MGGDDRPSEVLLTFLFRYGGVVHGHEKIDSHSRTRLTQYMAIECNGGFEGPVDSSLVDMGGVYQIDNCVSLFEACWFRLYDSLLPNLQRSGKNRHIRFRKQEQPTTTSFQSHLMHIIDSNRLYNDREDCINKAQFWTQHCKVKNPTLFNRISTMIRGGKREVAETNRSTPWLKRGANELPERGSRKKRKK